MHALKCLPPVGITSTPLVPWILWFLWKTRNKLVFENFMGSPVDTLSQSIVAAKEWEIAQQLVEKKTQVKAPALLPQFDVVAQSDAAWSESSHNAGLGWIISTPEIQREGSRSTSFITSAFLAEGLALRDGVIVCRSL